MHIFLYADVKYPFFVFFYSGTPTDTGKVEELVVGIRFWQVSEQWKESLHHFHLISR